MKTIHFHELNVSSRLRQRNLLNDFLSTIFKKERTSAEDVAIIFCDDEYLLSLNKKFLNHNYYTDTLTFLLSDQNSPVIGEIYISIDRVKANAESLNLQYQTELARVIIHSCLHLCGYEDKPQSKFQEMSKKQEQYLKKWNVSRET